jgi:peroxiredoxin
MVELGQLEAQHAEFARRQTRVVVVSLEDQETAKLTQDQFPHLVVVADAERGLAEAVQVIHPNSSPEGTDTTAPTTMILDGDGVVRWVFRAERFLTRLSPAEVLAKVDEHAPKN